MSRDTQGSRGGDLGPVLREEHDVWSEAAVVHEVLVQARDCTRDRSSGHGGVGSRPRVILSRVLYSFKQAWGDRGRALSR